MSRWKKRRPSSTGVFAGHRKERAHIAQKYFSFQVHITHACDQRCSHCYIFSEDPLRKPEAMSRQQMTAVLDNCLDFCRTFRRRPYFFVTGGDPLLHPDFWYFAGALKSLEIPFSILGNPFHLTEAVCRDLKNAGCEKYQMSLDGLRDTHDALRMPGSYDCTLEKLAILDAAQIVSAIMTTVSGINCDEISELMDVVVAHGADVYAFARYCPTSEEKDVGISPQDYRALLDACDRKIRAYESAGCSTYFNRKDHLWTLLAYEKGEFEIPKDAQRGMIYGGCHCGNSHLTILPTGDVLACRRVLSSRVGNVFSDRLATLWTGEMERYRDFAHFSKCAACELLAWCRGCPAVASGASGDFYAADPQCWKDTPASGSA